MTGWVPYVFVRVVACFAGGILLGMYYPDSLGARTAIILLTAGVCLYGVLFLTGRRLGWRPAAHGWMAVPVLLLAGYVSLLVHTGSRRADHLMHVAQAVDYYEVTLSQDPVLGDTRRRAEARVSSVHAGSGDSSQWRPASGRVMLYLAVTDTTDYHYGDVLLVRGAPMPVPAPANPGAFDYRRYLAYRSVYHQQFLRDTDVRRLRHTTGLMDYALRLRRWSAGVIRRNIQGDREQATAIALVLGVTDALDDDLLQAYAATGAMHVLAVSGLHISVLYFVIAFLLKPLQRRRYGAWLLAAVSIVLLWAYAFVTGLSPSVLRAVVMFTLVALADALQRRTQHYNTLAAAAFCLLLADPYLLWSVGFQLSFLAVVGILYIHPLLYARWQPANRWVGEAWKVTSVSIAAQLATFPLGLLYFHQFPNYFLFSNLLAVPGSSIVLVGGLVLLTCSVMPPIATLAGLVLSWLIKLLNTVIFVFESLPYSLVEDVQISPLQCLLLLIMIVLSVQGMVKNPLTYAGDQLRRAKRSTPTRRGKPVHGPQFVVKRRFSLIMMAGVVGILFSLAQWWHYFQEVNVSRLTVYAVPGHTAVDFIDHGRAVSYADTVLDDDHNSTRYHIRPNRVLHGVHAVHPYPRDTTHRGYRFLAYGDHTLLHVWKRGISIPESVPCDYVIISHNAVADLSALCSRSLAAPVILDSSNGYAYAQRMLTQSVALDLPVYSVPHAGAYDIDLKSRDHDEIYHL